MQEFSQNIFFAEDPHNYMRDTGVLNIQILFWYKMINVNLFMALNKMRLWNNNNFSATKELPEWSQRYLIWIFLKPMLASVRLN